MKQNRILGWIVLGAVVLAVLNLPLPVLDRAKTLLREAVAPFQRAAFAVANAGRRMVFSIRDVRALSAENQKLTGELARLRNEIQHLNALEGENAMLREQLGFADRSAYELIPCEVIGRGDLSSWWHTIRLGKGRAEGVTVDLAVIAPEGLIGKTTVVSPHTCDVLLIVDANCKVSGRIPRVDTFGIVRGAGVSVTGEAMCRMDFIDRYADVRAGDEVVTSGLGDVFPPGLLIGRVERVHPDESGLCRWAELVPVAELAGLRYVFAYVEARAGRDRPASAGANP